MKRCVLVCKRNQNENPDRPYFNIKFGAAKRGTALLKVHQRQCRIERYRLRNPAIFLAFFRIRLESLPTRRRLAAILGLVLIHFRRRLAAILGLVLIHFSSGLPQRCARHRFNNTFFYPSINAIYKPDILNLLLVLCKRDTTFI